MMKNKNMLLAGALLLIGCNTLIDAAASSKKLLDAVNYAPLDVVRELIAAKANKEATDEWGYTPLTIAGNYGRLDVMRELLAAKANIETVDDFGNTPLICAALNGNLDVVRELINSGANISAKTKKGQTPLDIANQKKHADIVRVLRDAREEELEPALGYLVNGPLSVPPLCDITTDYLF